MVLIVTLGDICGALIFLFFAGWLIQIAIKNRASRGKSTPKQ